MATTVTDGWRQELAIASWGPPTFFTASDDLVVAGRPVPQAHSMRRAFDDLGVDAIVCFSNAPLIYFREVERVEAAEVNELHRRFWSQGLAPVLVLISDAEVFVYSGLALPAREGETLFDRGGDDRLVAQLDRVTQAAELRQLVLSVESGEFFRRHSRSFDPGRRVDRELLRNLKAARDEMDRTRSGRLAPGVLDALLCRVIFACYLFDRKVIDRDYLESCGVQNAADLRDVVCLPKREARHALERLFDQLGRDFNGDLFRGDVGSEWGSVDDAHLTVLQRMLIGADVCTGQGAFWPYDFGVIPIETISSIYEHFLKTADARAKKESGAFYTPRFLCEVILDLALDGIGSLLGKRFLDPSCGSGIFLVGLFNRMAEEWKRANPRARYDSRANGLMGLLTENLFGADLNPTACHITAFSLYLAFLDQLSPPDIRKLQAKGKFLPPLVFSPGEDPSKEPGRSVLHGDFFDVGQDVPTNFDLVVGNPPWMSATSDAVPFVRWCRNERLPLPDRQAALAFAWKAPRHLSAAGRCCLVLPHGVLFNHGPVSLRFQHAWLTAHAAEVVLNLADFQRFLFEEAENPAVVIRYRKTPPADGDAPIRYLTPKMDWTVAQAELLSIYPQDQKPIRVGDVLADLRANGMPLIWKERYWGTPRDWKLLDRLKEFSKLSALAGRRATRWTVGQGFQKPGPSDGPDDRKSVTMPTRTIVEASGEHFALFLLPADCGLLPSDTVELRDRSNTNVEVFRGPHVLITDGFKVAFADFDATFRQSVRGITGPMADRKLLVFLSAYLNSPLAKYYLFHTSANLGVERAKAESADVLRLPFPLPEDAPAGRDAEGLVDQAYEIYRRAVGASTADASGRQKITAEAISELSELVLAYFDVDDNERILIEDTNGVLYGSARRRRIDESVPTLRPSTPDDRVAYGAVVCATMNDWARGGKYEVHSTIHSSDQAGVAVAVFHKARRGTGSTQVATPPDGFLLALERLQKAFREERGTVEMLRGVKVFDGDRLYVLKPLSQRFWTRTTALNDADEIAAAILSPTRRANA